MTITVKARYANGQLTPLEPLKLEEGAEVLVTVEENPAAQAPAHSLLEIFDRMHRTTPESVWSDMPSDGSKNIDHYLYDWPKAQE